MKLHQALFGFLLCCSCSTAEEAALQELPPQVAVVAAVVVEVPPLPIPSDPVQKRVGDANRTVGSLRDHPAVVAQAHDLARDSWTVRVGLRRADAFFAMIEEQLVHHNVPRELAFVPMVESVFHPEARGRRAVGLWQFTKATARAYGLRVDGQLDNAETRSNPQQPQSSTSDICMIASVRGSWLSLRITPALQGFVGR
jgi:hypothetical protein